MSQSEKTILGHPENLLMLFFTEMWERFSFYGMRALLTLYLTIQLFEHLQDPVKKTMAYGIYAAYGALVYATPFLGGIIADKYLGYKKSVLLGAILMAIGHFVMAIENEFWLYVALSFLIIGNGFFKPNISSIVGGLYNLGDSRRDAGFTIFYMGINLGAMLAPLACGALGEWLGWHWGFGLAGIGMLAGLVLFWKRHESLGENGEPSNPELLQKKLAGFLSVEHFIYLCSFLSVVVFAFMVKNYKLMTYVLTPFALGVFGILVIKALQSKTIERDRILVVLILLIFTTLFWAFFEQAGSSITMFTNENVDRSVFGISIPASLFQSANPFFILLLAPLFSLVWSRLAHYGKEPSTPLKFVLGLFILGLGFVAFYWGNSFIGFMDIQVLQGKEMAVVKAATVPLFFLLFGYMLHTMGELCLSPIGLSMVTKLSPKANVAMVMGAWFLSSAMAHHLGGGIAQLTAKSEYDDPIELAVKTYSEEENEDMYKIFSAVQKELLISDYSCGENIQAYVSSKEVDALASELKLTQVDLDKFTIASKQMMEQLCQNCEATVASAETDGFITTAQRNEISLTEKLSLSNLLQYNKVFLSLGLIAIFSSLLLLALVPLIRKMMHGVH